MDRPSVARLKRNRLAPHVLGPREIAALLQPESGHAENRVPAVVLAAERPQRLKRPVAQFGLSADEEAADMRRLQRQQVARVRSEAHTSELQSLMRNSYA